MIGEYEADDGENEERMYVIPSSTSEMIGYDRTKKFDASRPQRRRRARGRGLHDWTRGGIPRQQANAARGILPFVVLALPPSTSTTGDLPSKQILVKGAARPPQSNCGGNQMRGARPCYSVSVRIRLNRSVKVSMAVRQGPTM